MRPELVIDLMHDFLHTIQRDVSTLAQAALEDAIQRPVDYFGASDNMTLANHAANLKKKIDLIMAEMEPLATEHLLATVKVDAEHGKYPH